MNITDEESVIRQVVDEHSEHQDVLNTTGNNPDVLNTESLSLFRNQSEDSLETIIGKLTSQLQHREIQIATLLSEKLEFQKTIEEQNKKIEQLKRDKLAAIWESDHVRRLLEIDTENDLRELEELIEGERTGGGTGTVIGKKRRRGLEQTRSAYGGKRSLVVFTKELDDRIRQVVGQYGASSWSKIAESVGNGVTPIQCSTRWKRHLDPQIVSMKEVKSCTFFSEEMDERLKAAVNQYGREWLKVAEHVGGGVTNMQCYQRWTKYMDPALAAVQGKGPWTIKEDNRLHLYVEQHAGKGRRGRIDWSTCLTVLGRTALECKTRWQIQKEKAYALKKGPFSPEEDAEIRRMVEAWSREHPSTVQGRWTTIARALGRPRSKTQMRWEDMVSKGIVADVV